MSLPAGDKLVLKIEKKYGSGIFRDQYSQDHFSYKNRIKDNRRDKPFLKNDHL